MTNIRIKFILIALMAFCLQYGFSQQYFIKTYTLENGLPTRYITDACQDTSGIMWFATAIGITKYDGFSFTNFDRSSGLPERLYRKIKVDERGVLWAMPQFKFDSIVYYKNNRWEKIAPPTNDHDNYEINTFDIIYKNDKPVICLGSYYGYLLYENGIWTQHSISPDEELNYVYTVIAHNQKFYLSTKIGICILDGRKTDWSLNKLIEPFGKDIIAISFGDINTPNEKIWVLTENWLGYIQNNKFTLVSNKFRLPHPSIFYYSFIKSDTKGHIIFGNIWAKYYIQNGENMPIPLKVDNGFTSEGATAAFVDREQNIWITDTRGINKINNLEVTNYFKKNGLLEDEVTAVAEMDDGRIVFGHNKGLSILDQGVIKTIEFTDLKLNTRRVSDIMKDKSGRIWFTSISTGLAQLHPNGNITWYKSEKYPTITVVFQDQKGRIWVGADTTLLYLENNKFVDFKPFNKQNSNIRKIFSNGKGGIYLTGSNGLWEIQDDKVTKIPSNTGTAADNVFSYYKDDKGVEFVGTINGLHVIEEGKIVKYNKQGITINNPLYFIFQDKERKYWLGTNIGVYKWDGGSNLKIYNIYNGLSGWETNRAAGILDSKGLVWIGTDRGVTCFEPGYDTVFIPVPVIRLLGVEDSQGSKHSLLKKSYIHFSYNFLTFHFRGISFVDENHISYKYKLEGYDTKWQEVGQSMLDKVRYSGLRPGKYTFCIQAKNASGNWSEIVKSAPITITPPIYLRWWFYVLLLLILSSLIYGFIRFNVQRLHNKRLKIEILERKRIEKALGNSIQKYQDLVGLLPETVYETDIEGLIVYMNDMGSRLFGYPLSALLHKTLINKLIAPESIAALSMHVQKVLGSKQTNKTVLNGLSRDGSVFPLSIHTVPIIADDKCIGTRGIIIDLTEQKRFEDQLQQNAEDLKMLNISKDKFFSIIAHDLRSPFNSFLGFTEILDEEFSTLPDEEMRTIVSSMRKSATNLYQLLENLLEWSMFHRGIIKYEPVSIHLLPLVNECLEITSDAARQKEIETRIDIPETLEVEADTHMLQTIIRNILSNALKFSPRGGQIQISAFVDTENKIVVSVKDNGTGIKPAMMEHIFSIDAGYKTKGTEGELSTGLGLILCKEFVEKHGEKIWVESEENKGSTFYFSLKRSGASH